MRRETRKKIDHAICNMLNNFLLKHYSRSLETVVMKVVSLLVWINLITPRFQVEYARI